MVMLGVSIEEGEELLFNYTVFFLLFVIIYF